MELESRSEVRGEAALLKRARTRVADFCTALELGHVALSLTLLDDEGIRAVNAAWRAKDEPTDVLSFPAGDSPLPPGEPRPLGDLMVSVETTRRVAAEQGRSVEDELDLYLAHGLLHLLGHDHHRPAEAKRMAAAEESLLARSGMVGLALGPSLGLRNTTARRQSPPRGGSKRDARSAKTAVLQTTPRPSRTKRRAP